MKMKCVIFAVLFCAVEASGQQPKVTPYPSKQQCNAANHDDEQFPDEHGDVSKCVAVKGGWEWQKSHLPSIYSVFTSSGSPPMFTAPVLRAVNERNCNAAGGKWGAWDNVHEVLEILDSLKGNKKPFIPVQVVGCLITKETVRGK